MKYWNLRDLRKKGSEKAKVTGTRAMKCTAYYNTKYGCKKARYLFNKKINIGQIVQKLKCRDDINNIGIEKQKYWKQMLK